MNHKKTLLAILVLVVLIVLVSLIASLVPAQEKVTATEVSSNKLIGYAWSSNIGWVSFAGKVGASDYSVTINSDGTLTGSAWANPRDDGDPTDPNDGTNNIGWLRFDPPVANAPGGDTAAKFSNSLLAAGSSLNGWARFCAGASDPTTCSGTGANSNSDNWDGWVKMSGTAINNSNYGVKVDSTGKCLEGYAWGGEVVGWLRFGKADGSCDCSREVCTGKGDGMSVSVAPAGSSCVNLLAGNAPVKVDWKAVVTKGTPKFTYKWENTTPGGDGGIPIPKEENITSNTALTDLTYSVAGIKKMKVNVIDSGVGQDNNDVTADSWLTVKDAASPCSVCAYSDPCFCLANQTDSRCIDIPGAGAGVLTVAEPKTILIKYQPSGQKAETIVDTAKKGAQITNTGDSSITDVKIISIKGGDGQDISSLVGVQIFSAFLKSEDGQPTDSAWDSAFSSYSPGQNLGSLAVGQSAYLRLRVALPLPVVAANSPYVVTLRGDTSYVVEDVTIPANPTATLTFKYLVNNVIQE